jgi:amino acid transporter
LQKKPPVFVREATGLVREVGAWPSFMAVLALVTGGVPVAWVALMYTTPGANWPLAYLIPFVPSLLMAALFTQVGTSMPRSGGDYVFTTRGINPYVGFVNYWGVAAAYIISAGVWSFYTGTYIGYVTASVGAFYNIPAVASAGTFLGETWPSFALATAVLIVSFFLSVIKPRHTWAIIFWTGVISLICTAVMFVALAGVNASSFAASYNSFMGNATAYNSVIQTGGVTAPPNAMLATAASLPIVWFYYTWYNLPTTWSGEMKNVRKSMPIAILVSLTVIAVYYILMAVIFTHAFGQPFLENWGSLASTGNEPVPGVGGFIPFFALLVYKSPLLFAIMFVALWFPIFFEFPPLLISQTRYLFAWSFDRILPDKIASVSERFHTPIIATVIVTIIGVISAGIMAFGSVGYSGEYATLSFTMFSFAFIIPAIAGIVFPFRKKQLYETAFVWKKKILKLPLLTWLGLGSAVYLIYSTYLSYVSGTLPINSFSMTMYGSIYGLGVLVIIVSYVVNRRRGLPLDLVFKQIPPE